MAREEMIGVRVSEAEKRKFNDHIEDSSEYDSVPRMMRTLTRDHINEYGDDATGVVDPEEIVNAVEIGLSSVHERLENFEDLLAEVNAATVQSDERSAIMRDIVSELPVHPDGPDFPDLMEFDWGTSDDIRTARALSTVGAWATYFRVDEADARTALARAQQFPDVKFVQGKRGYRRYYKTTEDI
jgi:hypothetical protein